MVSATSSTLFPTKPTVMSPSPSCVGLGQRQSTFNQYFNDRLEANATGNVNAVLPYFQEILGGKANNGPSSYAPSYKDFAPRLAFAYNPSFSPKTVFNGSAAIVYDRTVINAINFLQDQLSFLFYNNNTNELGDLTDPDPAAWRQPLLLLNAESRCPSDPAAIHPLCQQRTRDTAWPTVRRALSSTPP